MSPTTTGHYTRDINPNINGLSISNGHSNSTRNGMNGSTTPIKHLAAGVYVPTVCFFDPETEDLDIITIQKHAVRLAKAGVAGLVTQGSNGEAVNLSQTERRKVTLATRNALDKAGFDDMPIIVGCGAQSTRETIELCLDASESGGDYALILPSAYYHGLISKENQLEYFTEVADASPIPLLIYNYPGAASGVDLDSDFITKLAEHKNIVGCKLTCGNSGKLARIAAATKATTPTSHGSGFMAMGGSADFTLQTMMVGGSGVIAGLANIAPKACVAVVNLYAAGNFKDARKMQALVARGDWAAIRGGLVGTKSCLESHFGYGGYGRKPLPRPTDAEKLAWAKDFKELVDLEKEL